MADTPEQVAVMVRVLKRCDATRKTFSVELLTARISTAMRAARGLGVSEKLLNASIIVDRQISLSAKGATLAFFQVGMDRGARGTLQSRGNPRSRAGHGDSRGDGPPFYVVRNLIP